MKLLVCDVEGTIFKAKYKIEGTDYASTMWQPLAQRLGEAAIEEEKETHKKWENKEYYNYIDWVEATVDIHKKYGLHIDVFNSLIDEAEYNDGVIEFFEKIDRSKYIPVLVSGGFQELIRRAQKELKIKYGYGACEYYFDQDSGLLSSHTMTPCDFEGKYHYVNALFGICNLNPNKDWLFIGDGKNDVHIAEKAPLSYGINSHSELAKIVSFNTNCFSHIYTRMIEDESIYIMDDDDLVKDDDLTGSATRDEEYSKLINERNIAIAEAESARKELLRVQSDLTATKHNLDIEIERRKFSEEAKEKLEKNHARLERERDDEAKRVAQLEITLKSTTENRTELVGKLEDATAKLRIKELEIDKNSTELNDLNNLLTESSLEIQANERCLNDLTAECNRIQMENQEHRKIEASARKREEKAADSRRKKIKDFWSLHFRHFSFTPAFLQEAAKLTHSDRMKLEEKLLQLHEAPDARSLSRSRYHDDGNDHLGLFLSGGVAARVDYRLLHGQTHRVEIVEFYKKKEYEKVGH
jgi:phosphoserine phosphatase